MKKAIAVLLSISIFFTSFTLLAGPTVYADDSGISVSEYLEMLIWVAENEWWPWNDRDKSDTRPKYTYESADGSSKYGKWYGDATGSWCMMFICWCLGATDYEFGVSMLRNEILKTSNQRVSATDFYEEGRFHKTSDGYIPKKGDLVYFDWSNTDWTNPGTWENTSLWQNKYGNADFHCSQHVGLVISNPITENGVVSFTIIDGNFSNSVQRRDISSYDRNSKLFDYYDISHVIGFASPDYEGGLARTGKLKEEPDPTPTPEPTPVPTQTSEPPVTQTPEPTNTPTQKPTATPTPKPTATPTPKPTATPTPKPTATPTPKPTTTPTPVREITSLSLQDSWIKIYEGENMDLVLKVTPSDTTETFSWTSDDEDIAIVSQKGRVYGISPGKTTVWCEASGGKRIKCEVEIWAEPTPTPVPTPTPMPVIEVETFTIEHSWILLYEKENMDVSVSYSPLDTTESFIWYSKDEKIAVVSQSGRVQAVGEGTTTVWCQASGGKTVTCKVEVKKQEQEDSGDDSEQHSENTGETQSETPEPSQTPAPTQSATPAPTATPTPTPGPTPTTVPVPTSEPTPTPSAVPTSCVTPEVTAEPSATPSRKGSDDSQSGCKGYSASIFILPITVAALLLTKKKKGKRK